jgi:hypothetical protein
MRHAIFSSSAEIVCAGTSTSPAPSTLDMSSLWKAPRMVAPAKSGPTSAECSTMSVGRLAAAAAALPADGSTSKPVQHRCAAYKQTDSGGGQPMKFNWLTPAKEHSSRT